MSSLALSLTNGMELHIFTRVKIEAVLLYIGHIWNVSIGVVSESVSSFLRQFSKTAILTTQAMQKANLLMTRLKENIPHIQKVKEPAIRFCDSMAKHFKIPVAYRLQLFTAKNICLCVASNAV